MANQTDLIIIIIVLEAVAMFSKVQVKWQGSNCTETVPMLSLFFPFIYLFILTTEGIRFILI